MVPSPTPEPEVMLTQLGDDVTDHAQLAFFVTLRVALTASAPNENVAGERTAALAHAGSNRFTLDVTGLPATMSTRDAMAIGTAGYTAMLAVMALEKHGITPDRGPQVVTGAAGGVGSVAIALLARLGYEVTASTGRPEEADYLKDLGAKEVIERKELSGTPRPLAKERWAGGVDSVGSTTLANVLSMIRYRGAVAACGLAGGMDLPTSVAPFILRGVSLLGIDSVYRPRPDREAAWKRLETGLDRAKLGEMTAEIGLSDVMEAGRLIVEGLVRGRIVVKIG